MKKIYIFLIISIFSEIAYGQTCCTSGTPILSSLEMSVTNKNIFQINLNYNYNRLKDIYDRDIKLEDDTRERLTQSLLLELSYGITRIFTITGLFSYVRQSRFITPQTGTSNSLTIRGIGDIVLLGKYNLIPQNIISKNDLTIGAGFKIPVGKSDVKQNNLLVPADLQPGTGSWDGILWLYYSRANVFSLPVNVILNFSYKLNGTNKRFGNKFGSYKFGNEFISTLGLVYFTSTVITPTFFIRIRNTLPDEFSDEQIPNTGGWWINIMPGLSYTLNENLIFRVNGQIPVYNFLKGVQLTTTFVATVSVIYSIDLSNSLGI